MLSFLHKRCHLCSQSMPRKKQHTHHCLLETRKDSQQERHSAFPPNRTEKSRASSWHIPRPRVQAAGLNLCSVFSPRWRCQVRSARALWRTGYHRSACGKRCPRDNRRDPDLKYLKGSQEYILTAFSDLLIQRHSSYLPSGEVSLAENLGRASQIRLPTARQRWGVRTVRAPSVPAGHSQGGNSGHLGWSTA